MRSVFADTYYFLAIANPSDSGHKKAISFGNRSDVVVVTTSWVITEFGNSLSRTPNRHLVRQPFLDLDSSPDNLIVPTTDSIFIRGLELYNARPDKEWSLVDCISFVVMNEHGLIEALTADHHFEQAGCTPLL